MKSLERRNEDLQDRILELEDEARQRERQQAKQIQEIRNAYEQQHRKLSEFTDFVKRYFPYVEKLMPVISFLRERLGFNDGIIRRLCEFKEVGIKANSILPNLTEVLIPDIPSAPSNRMKTVNSISR